MKDLLQTLAPRPYHPLTPKLEIEAIRTSYVQIEPASVTKDTKSSYATAISSYRRFILT